MSHQTGIHGNEQLVEFYNKAKTSHDIRAFKVSIKDEVLILDGFEKTKENWILDYDSAILTFVKDKQPCYIFYRLDTKGTSSYDWLFITWSPDDASVKQKMLYASTKATLKKDFGMSYIRNELFASTQAELLIKQAKSSLIQPAAVVMVTPLHPQAAQTQQQHSKPTLIPLDKVHLLKYNMDELSYAHYESAMKEKREGEKPFTRAEEEMKLARSSENQMLAGVDTKQKSMRGLSFPLTQELIDALNSYKTGKLVYIRMKIDVANEQIEYDNSAQTLSIASLPKMIPGSGPRYHLYRYKYQLDGREHNSTIFVYSMPGYSVSVKERMLYSSCKFNLIESLKEEFDICMEKTFEVEKGEELSKDYVEEELHPKQIDVKEKFSKPKGPASRGPRRLIKGTNL